MSRAWLGACLALLGASSVQAQETPALLLDRLEASWAARRLDDYLALWRFDSPEAGESEAEFARGAFSAGEARLTLERPNPLPAAPEMSVVARSMMIDEPRAHLDQWRLRLASGPGGWRLTAREPLGRIDGLIHLSLDPRGFRADGLVLKLPDFELRFERGTLFTSPPALGPTALVFVGSARLRLSPRPATEREQLRQFSGQAELNESVEQVYVRLHPADWHHLLEGAAELQPDPQASERLGAALRVFQAQAQQSYTLDVGLPGSPWWVLPGVGDALVSFRSKNGNLTFTVSNGNAEGISLFDREKKRQICLYPAAGKDTRYNEDAGREADVVEHQLKARFDPDEGLLAAEDTLRIRLRGSPGTLRLRLKDSLRVLAVTSREGGNHLFFRVRNQDSLMVSLGPLTGRPEIQLNVRYAGPLDPSRLEDEALQVPGNEPRYAVDTAPLESAQVFSNRALWYPQGDPDDYALADLELDVPAGYTAVAGGLRSSRPARPKRLVVGYRLEQPAKYLAVVVGRLVPAGEARSGNLRLQAWSAPRMRGESAGLLQRSAQILAFYERLFGPCPYPTLNLVLIEGEVPSGHSPPGMVLVAERPAMLRGALRDDPATLWSIPGFFLAHELAHQWWGQGVAGQNYRERWLSEGTAQYAAALWARHAYGDETFQGVLRHLARWATRKSAEGPINLGHRLGHLKQDPQIYRALVYSKGAYVLHMLSGLMGDEAFARALRGFQERYRYGKAGSDDLREALEQESGRDLKPYFEAWIEGTGLPVLSQQQQVAERPNGGYATTVRVRAQNLPGPLPLEISVRQDGQTTRERVMLVPDGGTFVLDTPRRPGRVQLNADQRLLAVVREP